MVRPREPHTHPALHRTCAAPWRRCVHHPFLVVRNDSTSDSAGTLASGAARAFLALHNSYSATTAASCADMVTFLGSAGLRKGRGQYRYRHKEFGVREFGAAGIQVRPPRYRHGGVWRPVFARLSPAPTAAAAQFLDNFVGFAPVPASWPPETRRHVVPLARFSDDLPRGAS